MMIYKPEVLKPWGQYKILHESPLYKIKEIIVIPNGRLSYQYHYQREETWRIIAGTGEITIQDIKYPCEPGMVFFIPKLVKHRIENTGNVPLMFVEIQTGESFEENDIVRIEDDYNRVK